METIETKIKQSEFKTWVALSQFLGYKKNNRSGLKQRIQRNINFLNSVLKNLGLEVEIKEIQKDEK